MRRATPALAGSGALLAALCCALPPALCAEDKPAMRDAAQVVQEGDVGRWLEHYQRERGAEWVRQQGGSQPEPSAQGGAPAPVQGPAK